MDGETTLLSPSPMHQKPLGYKQLGNLSNQNKIKKAKQEASICDIWKLDNILLAFPEDMRPAQELGLSAVQQLKGIASRVSSLQQARLLFISAMKEAGANPGTKISFGIIDKISRGLKAGESLESKRPVETDSDEPSGRKRRKQNSKGISKTPTGFIAPKSNLNVPFPIKTLTSESSHDLDANAPMSTANFSAINAASKSGTGITGYTGTARKQSNIESRPTFKKEESPRTSSSSSPHRPVPAIMVSNGPRKSLPSTPGAGANQVLQGPTVSATPKEVLGNITPNHARALPQISSTNLSTQSSNPRATAKDNPKDTPMLDLAHDEDNHLGKAASDTSRSLLLKLKMSSEQLAAAQSKDMSRPAATEISRDTPVAGSPPKATNQSHEGPAAYAIYNGTNNYIDRPADKETSKDTSKISPMQTIPTQNQSKIADSTSPSGSSHQCFSPNPGTASDEATSGKENSSKSTPRVSPAQNITTQSQSNLSTSTSPFDSSYQPSSQNEDTTFNMISPGKNSPESTSEIDLAKNIITQSRSKLAASASPSCSSCQPVSPNLGAASDKATTPSGKVQGSWSIDVLQQKMNSIAEIGNKYLSLSNPDPSDTITVDIRPRISGAQTPLSESQDNLKLGTDLDSHRAPKASIHNGDTAASKPIQKSPDVWIPQAHDGRVGNLNGTQSSRSSPGIHNIPTMPGDPSRSASVPELSKGEVKYQFDDAQTMANSKIARVSTPTFIDEKATRKATDVDLAVKRILEKASALLEHDETRVDAVALDEEREYANDVLRLCQESFERLRFDIERIGRKHGR